MIEELEIILSFMGNERNQILRQYCRCATILHDVFSGFHHVEGTETGQRRQGCHWATLESSCYQLESHFLTSCFQLF